MPDVLFTSHGRRRHLARQKLDLDAWQDNDSPARLPIRRTRFRAEDDSVKQRRERPPRRRGMLPPE